MEEMKEKEKEKEKILEDQRARAALEKGLEVLVHLNESGALELLDGAGELLLDSLSYFSDPRLLRVFANLAELGLVLSGLEPSLLSVTLKNLNRELEAAFTPETMKNPPQVGLIGLLKALSDPDVQRGLGFLFAFLKALGRAIAATGQELVPMMEEAERTLEELRRQRAEQERQIAPSGTGTS